MIECKRNETIYRLLRVKRSKMDKCKEIYLHFVEEKIEIKSI